MFGNTTGFCHWRKIQILTSFIDSLLSGVDFFWVWIWKQWTWIKSCHESYLLSVTAARPAISKMAEPSVERAAKGLLGLWGTEEPSWASMPVPVILHSWERFPGSCWAETARAIMRSHGFIQGLQELHTGLNEFSSRDCTKRHFPIMSVLNLNLHCCQSLAALRIKYAKLLNQTTKNDNINFLNLFFSYT